ncbi:MAG: ComEC/Rec2 family competence protein [bacterium]|nr:ComEC/Rec2 family competence protein [bacterium]
MTPSKIFFCFCISFIVGIFVNSIIKTPQIFLWAFLFIGVFLIFIFLPFGKLKRSSQNRRSLISWQSGNLIITGFCILFLVLGILRHQISEFNISNDELSKFNEKGKIILIGKIITEPDVRDTFQKIKVETEKMISNKDFESEPYFNIKGTILVVTSRYPEYKYLDKVKITGQLETPAELEDGVPLRSYKNYLLKDGIYSVMGFPKVELIINKNPMSIGQRIYSGILFFKQKLRESIRRNFLPPYSSILEGTVLGDNGALTQDLKDKLNTTGLRHIIAVSGTHVVILSAILMSLLLYLGLWRGQAFYFSVSFICLYIILTGMSSSGVRAGIMGGLYLLAQKLGRQSMGSRVIVMAGAVMLFINPLLLFYDVGFQLSFLAVFGLIYFEPFIKNILLLGIIFFRKKIFYQKVSNAQLSQENSRLKNAISIVSTTFAAQVFTLPIMVYNFGNISFVSPITNLLVLPIVSWLMIFGFLSSILGVASQFLGWVISMPCWFLLTYFIKIIDIFSQSWAMKTIENVSWIWLAIFYLLIGFVVRFLNKKKYFV